ncbi:hypothetical protein [Prosthecobacter fluviatilis]|uniref:Uncharacterized protein n=1 Tax=Prosthecobacter fluviatilis TaxID=445931 RepID=A0ABW0KXI2_9BACT
MKAFRLFLLLAACLVIAWVVLSTRCIRLDEKGDPLLINDEEVLCAESQFGALPLRPA